MSYLKATVMAVLSKIQTGEYVLPAIQRDFVWDPERMYKLLDSILRGYPFSTMLFWNTKQRIQFREFTKEWTKDMHFTFQVKPEGVRGTMILDGQQRLQTLYLAIYGHYDKRTLYFDLLSGNEPEDVSEAKYHFEYLTSTEAEKRHQENSGDAFWVPLRELVQMSGGQIAIRAMNYIQKLNLAGDIAKSERLTGNLNRVFYTLKGDENINYFVIDKEYGDDGLVTSLDEILEIFVRVNSGGQVLSKSDLMFSLLQMHWEGAGDSVAELVDELNEKGRFEFNKDFILKCALVCCGQGAKYEVDKLRNETIVTEIKKAFPKLETALLNCVEFLVSDAKIRDDRILRSYNTLLIFVYFFFIQPNQEVRGEDTRLHMSQVLYLALMTKVFSRLADNYTDQIVNNMLKPAHQTQPGQFPILEISRFIKEKQNKDRIDDWLLQNNITLLMNILEGGTQLPEGRRTWRPEVDHIFPRSKLIEKGYAAEQVNHFANFRLISRADNNWKRDKDPQPYFSAHPGAAERYLIPTDLLAYEDYPQFLEKRKSLIWKSVNRFLGMRENYVAAEREFESKPVEVINEPASPEFVNDSINTLREHCRTLLLLAEETTHPILDDQDMWRNVMPDRYGRRWKNIYISALKDVQILTVGDMAACIMALKLKVINRHRDGYHKYEFVHPGPNALNIQILAFGKWGWHLVLELLEARGFAWGNYVIE